MKEHRHLVCEGVPNRRSEEFYDSLKKMNAQGAERIPAYSI